jgi:hypothetical protein
MAQLVVRLTTTYTPAFYELMALAHRIAAVSGDYRAIAWVKVALEADIDLFCHMRAEPRPELRLVDGGVK